MNFRNLLGAVIVMAAFSSCSSVYKTGQTPDDVYYSAAKPRPVADEYVDVRKYQGNNYQTYDEYQDSYRDDRFLRMSVGNPYYMDFYDAYGAFDWRYNAYNIYGMGMYGMNSPWNNYYAWNSFYNPYFGVSCFGGGGKGIYTGGLQVALNTPKSRPVSFNVNSYGSGTKPTHSYLSGNYYNNNNQRYSNNNASRYTYYNNSNNYNNSRSTNNSYTPSNSNSTPSRSYAPSSSGSSSGSSGGGGSVSRPGRGGL